MLSAYHMPSTMLSAPLSLTRILWSIIQTVQLKKLKFREAKKLAKATQLIDGRTKVSPSMIACCYPLHRYPAATEHVHVRVQIRNGVDLALWGLRLMQILYLSKRKIKYKIWYKNEYFWRISKEIIQIINF